MFPFSSSQSFYVEHLTLRRLGSGWWKEKKKNEENYTEAMLDLILCICFDYRIQFMFMLA